MSTATSKSSGTITISPTSGPYVLNSGGGGIGTIYNPSIGGASGAVYTSSGTGSSTWATMQPSVSMSTSILNINAEGGGDAIIQTNKNKINLDEVATMMETLKQRMLIITPDFEKHEKYPALKEAYDNYKALEAMLSCTDDNK